ncbi:MAG: BREX-1 system adenine-specific DNA-methyltransferase PglX [Candidatus Thiodiazotropha lotti]|nr:BREX-1 system adenine-specific DNA-methyltransferase PglX [Candidatus Thiodiazotropha lotti]MCW4222423.1 BREX-1 system adenine-specific DNA-methyltransferase PglX [Candidatus Thiodiazotropha lotti]
MDLDATKSAKKPWVSLDELEVAKGEGKDSLEKLLKERTGSAISRVRNDLKKSVEPSDTAKLLTACHNDQELSDRVEPYFHLLRIDDWGYPLVYPEGTFMVTTGTERRETGTHYTPKSLTESIVKETLEPIVYIGLAEGKPREGWQLKTPAELLDLKVCDPAMGSGAFLVQVCRWLAERLVESWEKVEAEGRTIDVDGVVHDDLKGFESLPTDLEERIITARRLIAERCLYGVDINPLAVELAKLSIWLVTLSKGRPFGFLDHSLRSGDSLLGIHDIEQLVQLHPDPTKGEQLHTGLFDHRDTVRQAVERAMAIRLEVRTHRVRDIADVHEMERLNASAQEGLIECQAIADAIIGETLASPGALDDGLISISVTASGCLKGDQSALQDLRHRAKQKFATDLPIFGATRDPFHWVLEYPEVFLRESGGFDAFVGNPPFLGGKRITGSMGTAYRNYIVDNLAQGEKGVADLVAYFFLRAYQLIREGGDFGLIAVNTISEGDTRQVGLERLVGVKSAVIYSAFPSESWPGKAAVVTSRVHIRKGKWTGQFRLGGRVVDHISAFLSDQDEWTPMRLSKNAHKSFIGSVVLGMGFTMSEDDAMAMIENNSKNSDVLFPYMNGKDLNSNPEQKPSRWVINFYDWPEERARDYIEPFNIVLKKVKPERDKKKRAKYRNRWWQYAEAVPNAYHAIGRGGGFISHPEGWDVNMVPMDRIIGITRVSKYLVVEFLPNDRIFTLDIVIFSLNRNADFAVLQSSFHCEWAWKHASRMKRDLRYTPSDTFETFPYPDVKDGSKLELFGREYQYLRSAIMVENGFGLTKLYNRFHDKNDKDCKILELRKMHQNIDDLVAEAYGWSDLVLGHDFHSVDYLPENDRVRYTISEEARLEILSRLSQLNKEWYEEELKQGLHAKKKPKKEAAAKKRTKAKIYEIPAYQERRLPRVAEPTQMDLLNGSSEPTDKDAGNQWGSNPIDQILAWLEANTGWHAKQAILNGCQADPSRWDSAIGELLKEGLIEADGDLSRYQAVP